MIVVSKWHLIYIVTSWINFKLISSACKLSKTIGSFVSDYTMSLSGWLVMMSLNSGINFDYCPIWDITPFHIVNVWVLLSPLHSSSASITGTSTNYRNGGVIASCIREVILIKHISVIRGENHIFTLFDGRWDMCCMPIHWWHGWVCKVISMSMAVPQWCPDMTCNESLCVLNACCCPCCCCTLCFCGQLFKNTAARPDAFVLPLWPRICIHVQLWFNVKFVTQSLSFCSHSCSIIACTHA